MWGGVAMEQGYEEEATQQSARDGAWPTRWIGVQRGQAARQSRKWPQGRLGQEPQEAPSRPPQRAASPARPQKEIIESETAATRARLALQSLALANARFRH